MYVILFLFSLLQGWGHLKAKGSGVPNKLREVEVKVLYDDICAKMLSGYPWDSSTQTMLCAGGEDKVMSSKRIFIWTLVSVLLS